MSNWDFGVVTDAGVTLLNKIEGGIATAVIDTIAIGSGVYSSSEKATIARRTALKNQQLSATINSKLYPDDNTLEVKASIDNTTVLVGFNITECGVYATVTEGGSTSTILFAIAYTETPDYMSAYNGEYPQIVIEDFYLPISNTDAVTVEITPSAFALAEDLTDHESEKASTSKHGHAIIIDALTSSTYADGEVLSAKQGYVLKGFVDKAYKDDDTAETDIADDDYFPFYDTSATTKKKTLWSTIVSKLKNMFSLSSNLAPIANGPKYPAAWSAGKQFVYQGQLCKTKVNVSTADDITVGASGNAQLDSDITSQISNLINNIPTTGIGLSSSNNIFRISPWQSITAKTSGANANTEITMRCITNVMFYYDGVFGVDKTSVTNDFEITIDGSTYHYAPLYSLSGTDAGILLGSLLPTNNGKTVALTRMTRGTDQLATTTWRIYRYSATTFFILDDSLRASTSAELTTLIKNNKWIYNNPGSLYFLYNYAN